jgi:hypothetical protein
MSIVLCLGFQPTVCRYLGLDNPTGCDSICRGGARCSGHTAAVQAMAQQGTTLISNHIQSTSARRSFGLTHVATETTNSTIIGHTGSSSCSQGQGNVFCGCFPHGKGSNNLFGDRWLLQGGSRGDAPPSLHVRGWRLVPVDRHVACAATRPSTAPLSTRRMCITSWRHPLPPHLLHHMHHMAMGSQSIAGLGAKDRILRILACYITPSFKAELSPSFPLWGVDKLAPDG